MKKTVKYNKLIRDKIPEIVATDGWMPRTIMLNKKEFFQKIKEKIVEEAKELALAKNKNEIAEELADIMELTDALMAAAKFRKSEIKKIQSQKRKKRGGFEKRLFLISETKN